jgi:hypothetical protein
MFFLAMEQHIDVKRIRSKLERDYHKNLSTSRAQYTSTFTCTSALRHVIYIDYDIFLHCIKRTISI